MSAPEPLSAERLAEIADLLRSTGWARTVNGPSRWLYEAVVDLAAENAALRSSIVDLEAERDAAMRRADEWYAHAKRAVAEGDELRARAAADTPKLQAAQRVAALWTSGRGLHPLVTRDEWEAACDALAAAFTEEPTAPKETP